MANRMGQRVDAQPAQHVHRRGKLGGDLELQAFVVRDRLLEPRQVQQRLAQGRNHHGLGAKGAEVRVQVGRPQSGVLFSLWST